MSISCGITLDSPTVVTGSGFRNGGEADMTDGETTQRRPGSERIFLMRCLLASACVAIAAVLLLGVYLNSSQAAVLVSRILTDYLRQPVRVTALRTDGATISLIGVTLGNPPDVSPGNLCRMDVLTIAPDWGNMLTGRRSLRLLSCAGLVIDLRRNSSGVWNFSRLQQLVTGGKKATGELFIQRLVVKNGTLLINGHGVRDISLKLLNLTTKGSNSARLDLSFEDYARNCYSLTGLARPGRGPELDLLLSASSLSLKVLEGIPQLKGKPLLTNAKGTLKLTAVLRAGRFRVRGCMDFSRVSLPVTSGKPTPASGKVELSAEYDSATDQVRLESLTLALNNLVAARVVASVDKLRTERRFSVDLGLDQVNLSSLDFLLPETEQQKTRFGGTLGSSKIHLTGDAAGGVNKVGGTLFLRDVWMNRSGRTFFTGVNAILSLSGNQSALLARGNIFCRQPQNNSLLESLEAPFFMVLSGGFKPLKFQVPNLTARAMGCAITGKLGFNSSTPAPFSAGLRLSTHSIARLNPVAGILGLKLESGGGSVCAEAAGRGIRDFSATANLRLSAVKGTRGVGDFGITNGLVDARFVRKQGIFSVNGAARLSGLDLNGKRGAASFSYRVADEIASLTDGVFQLDAVSVKFARLVARMPLREAGGGTVGYPLSADISGGIIHYGEAVADGVAGKLRARLLSGPGGKWLEGESDIAAGQVLWQGKAVGSPTVRFTLSRAGGSGELGGKLLGAALDGAMAFKPFSPGEGGTFRIRLKGVKMAELGNLLPRRNNAVLSNGALDGSCAGVFSATNGVTCNFKATGSDIAVNVGSKTLFSGGGLNLDGGISRSRFALDRLLLSAGTGVTLALAGELADPFKQQREGRFVLTFPETPLNTVVDRFVNMLPQLVQEANVDGNLAASGSLVVKDGRQRLDGSVRVMNVLLDAPSQKFKVSNVNGTFPFSIDLSGKAPVRVLETAGFTRANYPRLLERLSKSSGAVQTLSIGDVAFGPLDFGAVKLVVNAGDGVTRITSLRSSLYEGTLLGSGYVTMERGLTYRADLLVNDLSLRLLCASIPRIKDYISGRVDGVISLGGAGKGLSGLSGFTEMWAREGGDEKMLISRVFLQKLSGKNLSGVFFRKDRPFDQAEIVADLENGYLTFEKLDISHTNIFGVRDLSVTIAPSQNRIALDHLFNSIIQASARGKAASGENATPEQSAEPEFKWQE